MFFSDLHIELLSRGVLEHGENLVAKTVAEYKPWWGLGLVHRLYLVLATDRRLVLLDHRAKLWGLLAPLQLQAVDSLAWNNVKETKFKGLLGKKLKIDGQGDRGPVNLTMKVPNAPFGPMAVMKKNVQGARHVGQVFANAKTAGANALAPAPGHFRPMLSQ